MEIKDKLQNAAAVKRLEIKIRDRDSRVLAERYAVPIMGLLIMLAAGVMYLGVNMG